MEKSQFYSSSLYSHSNGNLLAQHLFAVGYAMWRNAPAKKELAFLLGIIHDFGKTTSFFQEEKILKSAVHGAPSHHTLISMYFAVWLLEQKQFDGIFDKFDTLIAVFVVNHHSSLVDFSQIQNRICKYKSSFKQELKPQINNILSRFSICEKSFRNEVVEIAKSYNDLPKFILDAFSQINIKEFLELDFCELYCDKVLELYEDYRYLSIEKRHLISLSTRSLYATLIYADRQMAKMLPNALSEEINGNKFSVPDTTIKDSLPTANNEQAKYRKTFFDIVDSNCDKESKLFTLTAPTGAGKTLAGVNAALKLQSKYKKDKIIYALPMTNIIEQTHSVLRKILLDKMDDFEQNEFDYLLKHHYMATYDTKEESAIYDTLESAEGWKSQIIITTFVQFFSVIGGSSPSFLARMPKLQNSVIVLDEPQVLKPEHWFTIRAFLVFLVDKLNAIVILMTATKPPLFELDQVVELSYGMDFRGHLRRKGRHKIVADFCDEICLDGLLAYLFDKGVFEKKSVLIVLNTIASVKELCRQIKDNEKLKDFNVFGLSTNLLPIHRNMVIEKINTLLSADEKVLLVSTQTIEAGVDLDFSVGFRDLAPLPSIIQTAGRINRHGLRYEETLFVAKVKKDERQTKSFGEFVYDPEFLRFTENILSNGEKKEFEFENITEIYFQMVKQYIQNKAKEIEEQIATLDFQKFSEKFQIIEEDKSVIPVFVEFNEEAKKIVNIVKELKTKIENAEDYEESFKLSKLKDYEQKKLYKYIINARVKNIMLIDGQLYFQANPDDYDFDEVSCFGDGLRVENLGLFY